MPTIDLITGFLGSGKTTFIKEYASYLQEQGRRVGILENDHGAVNVDMMLLQELEEKGCGLEMVAAACDEDCYRRRFKTKLITIGMYGYERAIMEPSGVFDAEGFFDVINEEPLDQWYTIGSVVAIVDAGLEKRLSKQAEFLLASQLIKAGIVILSKVQCYDAATIEATICQLEDILSRYATGQVNLREKLLVKAWSDFTHDDYTRLQQAGYDQRYYVRHPEEEDAFTTLYYMNLPGTAKELAQKVNQLMQEDSFGQVFRVKGFVKDAEGRYQELNATKDHQNLSPIARGQDVLVVIGEHLKPEAIDELLGKKNGTIE